eukprot:949149_1
MSRRSLHEAIRTDDIPKIEEILQNASAEDINGADENGETALTLAVSGGKLEILSTLLMFSCVDLSIVDKNSSNLLMLAIENGSPECVQALVHRSLSIEKEGPNSASRPLNMEHKKIYCSRKHALSHLSWDLANIQVECLTGDAQLAGKMSCSTCMRSIPATSPGMRICSICQEVICLSCVDDKRKYFGQTAVMLAHTLGHESIVQFLIHHTYSDSTVAIETPFDTSHDKGACVMKLPETVYSLPFIIPHLARRSGRGDGARIGFYVIVYLINLFVQSGFVMYLHIMNLDSENDMDYWCTERYVLLLSLVVYIFVCFLFDEVFETIWLILYLLNFPVGPNRLTVLVQADGSTVMGSGMTSFSKDLLFLVVIVPKLTIATGLFILGGPFLSDSEAAAVDLIRDSIALVFILELDELMFKGFIHKATQEEIANLPGIKLDRM